MCGTCSVPVCKECRHGLYSGQSSGTIPMSVANDNYFTYVAPEIVEGQVTWLEGAAASVCWNTILVCYLEEPYGHLMGEKLDGPQARTKVKGNLFSFVLPWEDIAACCARVMATRRARLSTAIGVKEGDMLPVALPLDEATLAMLVNVHVVGGNKDLGCHLEGVTMRVDMVMRLIELLRASGCPGYELDGLNSREMVDRRTFERYRGKYGIGAFIPDCVREAIASAHRATLCGPSLASDKSSTPDEIAAEVHRFLEFTRPAQLVPQQSSKSLSQAFDENKFVYSKHQTLNIQIGSSMLPQFNAQYLGMANLYALPVAVSGVDFPGKVPWRRPVDDADEHGVAARVSLFDLLKGTSQHILGQFRRNWSFLPSVYNLWFRSEINLGANLRVSGKMEADETCVSKGQSAATAAADLYRLLESGYFLNAGGKRRRTSNDTSELMYAEGVTKTQRALLSAVRFRTRLVPGTREITHIIGHIGFWASVVYGNCIFMTISPGERHNYLAIRLSRYRFADPYVNNPDASDEKPWTSLDLPSLRAGPDRVFGVDIPGYSLRRRIQAKDPLCCANAFVIQIRVILATLAGVRMCPSCPHCHKSESPCQGELGCNAELMDGFCGRWDAFFGAVASQKSNGSLHFHLSAFVQRLHQHKTLQELADLLEQ